MENQKELEVIANDRHMDEGKQPEHDKKIDESPLDIPTIPLSY